MSYQHLGFADDAWNALLDDSSWDEGIRQNRRFGMAAQRRFARALARRRFRTQQEVGIALPGRTRPGRLDIIPRQVPGSTQRAAPFVYESKHINLPRYTLGGGALDTARLVNRVRLHVTQALNYQAAIPALNARRAARQLPALPARVRLVYQVPPHTARSLAAQFQSLALSIARPLGIGVTVVMPGTLAARAFDAFDFL